MQTLGVILGTGVTAGFLVFSLLLYATPTRHGWRHMCMGISAGVAAVVNQTLLHLHHTDWAAITMWASLFVFLVFTNLATMDWRATDAREVR